MYEVYVNNIASHYAVIWTKIQIYYQDIFNILLSQNFNQCPFEINSQSFFLFKIWYTEKNKNVEILGGCVSQQKIDNKVFLIDASSFLYRAYYGLRPLHGPDGKTVQAVYGFVRMIKKVIDTFDPQSMAMVWDSKGKTERHEEFPDYKATRDAPPSDLFEQKELIVKFADMVGLKQLGTPGIEADDIIYSLAQDAVKEGKQVIVISSDKDLYQMLTDDIYIYDPFKEATISPQLFEETKGFSVDRLPFYHALLGDASDNIPGVKGIGKKGATDLVTQFESLEQLYENLDQVTKPRMKKALEENKDNAFLSEKLFLLRYHKPELTPNKLSFDKEDWVKARPMFEELNFKSLLKGMPNKKGQQMSLLPESTEQLATKYQFKLVTTPEELKQVVQEVERVGAFATDTETTGINPYQDEWVGISISVEEGISYYIPVAHRVDDQQLSKEEVLAAVGPLLENVDIKKYLHHAKFDMHVMQQAGVTTHGVAYDTMIAASLIAEDWQSIGLKQLSESLLKEPMLSYSMVVGQVKVNNFAEVPLKLATEYAAADSHQTLKLYNLLSKKVKEAGLEKVYDLENQLLPVLFEMESKGIRCDVAVIKELAVKIQQEITDIEAEIKELSGNEDINLNSPKQIEELLFHKLMLPPKKRKKTGYSTDQEVLEELALIHPIPGKLLKYRELSKLMSTYLTTLPYYVDRSSGRIHTSFSQTRTATGRLASSDPNLQNIPVVSDVTIRSAFIPAEGSVFLSADYSQIELRILAFLSQDPVLKQAFLENRDIHAQTAAGLFNVPIEEVTSKQRGVGKRINFSILYGLTPFGLSKDLKISLGTAKEYIEQFFRQYPRVAEWMNEVVESTVEKGYTETYWGRRRKVPGIYEKNKTLYEAAKRIAINTVAQGTAAEVMKKGMIELHAKLKKISPESHILLQIHDELLIEVPEKEIGLATETTKETLENIVDWDVPLIVGSKAGKNWQEVSK